jgi:membrane associated rhomboid family serine protease
MALLISALLVVVHVITAAVVVRPGLPLWQALLLSRSVRHRIAVGGQWGPLVLEEPWRLCTTVLLHVDALHLTLNVLALLGLGQLLEPRIGGVRMASWAALGGFAGALASHLVGIRQSDGASGAAFALLGAALVVGYKHRPTLSADDRFLWGPGLGAFLGLNLVLSVIVPSINAVAHVGGLLAGFVLAALPERPLVDMLEALALGVFLGACAYGWTLG